MQILPATDDFSSEREGLMELLTSSAVNTLDVDYLVQLTRHSSRTVAECAQQAIDIRNGGRYNLTTGKVEFPK